MRSKARMATSSLGLAWRTSSTALLRASLHRFSRRRLALVSSSTTIRVASPPVGAALIGLRRKGRAKASASRPSTAQRRRRRRMFSSRLLRVTRGGVGARNMSVLKSVFSREVRRMRWNRIGAAMAAAPRRKSGARKLMRASSQFAVFLRTTFPRAMRSRRNSNSASSSGRSVLRRWQEAPSLRQVASMPALCSLNFCR